MSDLIERLKDGEPCQTAGGVCRVMNAESGCTCAEAAGTIKSLQQFRHDAKVENAELHSQIESLQREKEDLQSLADTAGMDAERAITRADKAELDLKCLQESTVDAKAYQALQRTNEELKRENGELRRPVIERCPPDLDPDENCPVCLAKPGGICRQGFPGAAITPEMREKGENLLRAFEHNMFGLEDDMAQWMRDLLGEQEGMGDE